MAYVWMETENGQWAVAPLSAESYELVESASLPLRRHGAHPRPDGVWLWQSRATQQERWLLRSPDPFRVQVNGEPLFLGLRVLRHKDELRLGNGQRFFFSTEKHPQVAPFPAGQTAVSCARCRQEITGLAVQCPQCQCWCHQSDSLPCWTYGPTCPFCDQPTDLNAGFRWTPEGL